jgi:hypothetical protein
VRNGKKQGGNADVSENTGVVKIATQNSMKIKVFGDTRF